MYYYKYFYIINLWVRRINKKKQILAQTTIFS
jgi:hypothetical protein